MQYNRLAALIVLMIVFAPLMVSCGQKEDNQNAEVPTVQVPEVFVGDERPVIAKLFEMWSHAGHVASVDQAAAHIGKSLTDAQRADILKKFWDNPGMHEKLTRYRPNIYVLTNEEKLISQFILTREKRDQEFPTLEMVAQELKMSPDHVKDRLTFLTSLEMFYDLGGPDEYNKLGFSFGAKLADFTFDLGLHQHVFRVDGGKPVNVGCAKEALFVVATVYPTNRVEYHTYDPSTLEPIEVVFDEAQIKSIKPESARLLEGGTCGTNNLFVSEENAKAAAATMPQFQSKEAPVYTIEKRFEDVKLQASESK